MRRICSAPAAGLDADLAVGLPFRGDALRSAASAVMPAPVFGTMGVNPGGPINATTTLSLFAYKIAFERCDFGRASAVGTIWLVLLAAFAVIYVRFLAAQR